MASALPVDRDIPGVASVPDPSFDGVGHGRVGNMQFNACSF
jgi:hypothetical protein